VTFAKTTYNGLPNKFEAGTPNISGSIGLGAAVDFLQGLDRDAAERHETALLDHATAALSKIRNFASWVRPATRQALVSFAVAGVHPHDLGTILDEDGIAIRTGHSLRHAGHGVLQTTGDGARLVRVLQYLRGNR